MGKPIFPCTVGCGLARPGAVGCTRVSGFARTGRGSNTFHHEAARAPRCPKLIRRHAGVGPGVCPGHVVYSQAAVLREKHPENGTCDQWTQGSFTSLSSPRVCLNTALPGAVVEDTETPLPCRVPHGRPAPCPRVRRRHAPRFHPRVVAIGPSPSGRGGLPGTYSHVSVWRAMPPCSTSNKDSRSLPL